MRIKTIFIFIKTFGVFLLSCNTSDVIKREEVEKPIYIFFQEESEKYCINNDGQKTNYFKKWSFSFEKDVLNFSFCGKFYYKHQLNVDQSFLIENIDTINFTSVETLNDFYNYQNSKKFLVDKTENSFTIYKVENGEKIHK